MRGSPRRATIEDLMYQLDMPYEKARKEALEMMVTKVGIKKL